MVDDYYCALQAKAMKLEAILAAMKAADGSEDGPAIFMVQTEMALPLARDLNAGLDIAQRPK